MDKCPKCGSKFGFYEKLRTNYQQYYTWDGSPSHATDGLTYGGKRQYCGECNKDVTALIAGEAK